ncbi:MAG TPA: hypothetical protein VGJ05_08040 [Fimbriiglobus sp.]|jgi:hypothetical protein
MARRSVLFALTTAAGLWVLAAGGVAQPPAAKKPAVPPIAPSTSREGAQSEQEKNAALFRQFAEELLRLAQKLEKSDKPDDQARAKTIRTALDAIEKGALTNQFKTLIEQMRANPNKPQDFNPIMQGDQQLVTALNDILAILMTDDESARIKAEIARLEAFLKEIKDLKRRTEIARALTEAKKSDKDRLAKNQGDLAKDTKDIADRMAGKKPGSGKPKDGKPKAGQPSDGPPKDGSGNPSPPGQSQPKTPGQKNVQQAVPPQQEAEKDLEKDKRPDASKQQDQAIKELEKAMAELEKRLKQLREEEKAKLLANLEARCNRMLGMQVEVYNATKSIHETILKNGGQKATSDVQKSQQQADKEGAIVNEADKCLKLLETEGSAVAFAQVLEEVRADMFSVQRRLGITIVDSDTQSIEENIIAMLKEMIAALKKAQQDLKNPPPSNPSNNNNKPNQKLINLLAELKLIRSMQMMVNSRTKMYGKKFAGEQAADPIIDAELKQLAQRQAKLEDMINKIATGENQ